MAWYRAGTVALTNGSATVTGSGTAFIANAGIGEAFLGPDGRAYEITDIPSNTSLTINPVYLGSTASGQSYSILPARGRIADLIAETQSLLASFAPVRDGIGAGLFPDGSAAAPAFRFANDQDTGIFRSGTNAASLAANGVDQFTWNANGVISRKFASLLQTDAVGVAAPTLGVLPAGASALFGINGLYGLLIGTNGTTGNTWMQSQRIDGTGTAYNICLQPSGGNVGIGTASPTVASGSGLVVYASATPRVTLKNSTTGDGSGDGGGLFVDGLNLCIENRENADVVFHAPTERFRIQTDGVIRPGSDNAQSLGTGSFRFTTVFATTGTINTSDERDKHWRGPLNAAELRAAKRIIAELGIYQWNDAVAEKGEDGARLHFGVRAQRAFAILEDEGLDWSRYAWACYDQWEEQTEPVMEEVTVTKTRKAMRPSTLIDPATGQPAMVEVDEAYEETEMRPTGETRVTLEAGDRYGVRPDQLAFWLIAAQAAIQADLEARLVALERAA